MSRARTALGIAGGIVGVLVSAACSTGVAPIEIVDDAKPTPLAIVGPNEGLFYTDADDDDPATPGIQLTVRVDVDDDAMSEVRLAVDADALTAVVSEDLAGRRAAFFDVTLASTGEHPAVARALDAEARATLVAR